MNQNPTATFAFFEWFYNGLGGLGGWFLFMLLAFIAVVWMLYDASSRRLPAPGWKVGILVAALLTVPAMLYRFTVTNPLDMTAPLYQYSEPIFYLGLLGGVAPIVIAIGYYVTYQGLRGCPQGHIYEVALGNCPECARLQQPVVIPMPQAPAPVFPQMGPEPVGRGAPLPPSRPRAQAWLTSADGHNYQLFLGETSIGRSSTNDICITTDTTVGRQHAKIVEQNGLFRLVDLGSKNFTRVNKKIVRQPVMLEPDDEVQFGDSTVMRFVSTRR